MMNVHSHATPFLLAVLLFASFVTSPLDDVFAEPIAAQVPPPPTIFFTNVHVDANPVPDKPFIVTADVQSQSVNWSSLVVYMSAPSGVSVVTPIIANLAFTNQGNTMRASWTMMAGSSGSYPLVITAHSNFPYDTETFPITVNVGSPHSVIVTGIDVPGDIFPNDNFTVGIKLKNAASVMDSNILSQIYVPAGLQLLDNATRYGSSVMPNQELDFVWKLKAENAGSYIISFNFSSANAGSNSVSAGVNVGNLLPPTGGLISIKAHSSTLLPDTVNSVMFDIMNNGVQKIHNLQIVSASGGGYVSTNTPLWIGDLDIHSIKTVPIKIYTPNDTLSLQIPIAVKYDSGQNEFGEVYQTELPLGNQPVFKINSVTVTPPLSYAGDAGDRIDIQLFNSGISANDVYANLKLPEGLSPAWGNSTSVYFGRINTFQTVVASFFVNVDNSLKSNNYPISLLIATGNQQTALNVNFIVSPKAQFQILSEDDSQLYPGATNVPFKVTLKNTGTYAAQTIITTLLAGNSVPGVKSDTITGVGNMENIGTVLPGQTFVTTFLVDVQPQLVAGDQSTTVQINWSQNSTNTSNSFIQAVTVPYHVAQGPYYLMYYEGIPWTLVSMMILLMIGIVVFRKKRSKKIRMMELETLAADTKGISSLEIPDLGIPAEISAEKKNEKINRTRISIQDPLRDDQDLR